MNSNKLFGLIVLLLLFANVSIWAQEEELLPEPPKPPTDEWMAQGEENEDLYLKNLNSESRVYLETVKKYKKARYWDLLRNAYWSRQPMTLYRQRDKELYERQKKITELEIGAESLGLKYQNEKSANKSQIKNELQKKLYSLFDLREEMRKVEVAELRERLEELQKSIESRIKNKDEIVKRRLQELLGEDKYLDWD